MEQFLYITVPSVTDPHPAYFDSDPYLHQSDANLLPLAYRPSRVPFLCLHPSFVSVHGPPWLHFINADPDPSVDFDAVLNPACHFSADPDPTSENDADPDLEH
jgi:hypothetical protein